MARPTKRGLDYFPFDVGFFGDKGIRILKARYGSDGIAVYIKLLCDIYKEGYFLPVECWEDYVFVIADEIGATFDKVQQVITFLQARAMVRIFQKGKDELTGLDVDAVITSHGIQKRYAAAQKSRRKKSIDEIKRGFWLLSEEEEKEINAFYKSGINGGLSENNPDKSENNPNKTEENPTKEKKVKEITCTDVPHAKEEFFKRYPLLSESAQTVDDSGIDYERLTACFERSKKHLQNRRAFSWVAAHYAEILAGKYEDFPEAEQAARPAPALPPAVQAANDKADRDKFYADRRNAAMRTSEKVFEKVMKNATFEAAFKRSRDLDILIAKAEINEPQKVEELRREQSMQEKRKAAALAKMGLTVEDLFPKWHCSRCEDTGFLPSGHACNCYKP